MTYESVLKRVRQAYHALVAEWLIEHAGERADEFTSLIADHLELAGSDKRAGQYLLQAGKQAAGKFGNQEAVSYLSRALALTAETDSEIRYEILREREEVHEVIGDREAQEGDLNVMETLADALADRDKQAETALLRAHYADWICEYQSSLQAAQKVVRIAQETNNLEQEAAGQLAWGRALWHQFEYDQANQKFEQALELAQNTGSQQLEGRVLRHLGLIAGAQNNDSLFIKYHRESLALCRKIGDRIGELFVLGNLGGYYSEQFDFEQALEYHQKALALSREIGHKALEVAALINLGDVQRILGDYQEAWNAFEQSLPINRQIKNNEGILGALFGLAYIAFAYEDYQSLMNFSEEGLSVTPEELEWLWESYFLEFLGRSFIGLEKWSEVEKLLEKSIEILIKIDRQEHLLYRWDVLARLYLAQGLLDRAVQQVDLILDALESSRIKETDFIILIPLLTCCQVLGAANDQRFQKVLEMAYNHLQNLAGKISNEDMRSSFLNNVPWHRGIIEMWKAEQEKKPLIS